MLLLYNVHWAHLLNAISVYFYFRKLKIIDAYLTYIFFTGVFQFLYCCLVSTFSSVNDVLE